MPQIDASPPELQQLVEHTRLALDGLARQLAQAPGDGIPAEAPRLVLVELERIKNMVEATQARAMAMMGQEAQTLDAIERGDDDRPVQSHEEFVPDEIAVLLSCTKAAASYRYGTARQAQHHESVGRAWRGGAIDARKVAVIADLLQHLDPETSDALAEVAVQYSQTHTGPQTREWLRRKVLAAAPEVAEQRRVAAREDRRVVVTPAHDGMSELWAWLPSVDARRMQQALTHLAHGVGADDGRTMDQRRADALVDLVVGDGAPTSIGLQVVVSAETLAGDSDGPAWVPGLGPITAGELRELLQVTGEPAQSSTTQYGTTQRGTTQTSSRGEILLADPVTGTLAGWVETRYRPSRALDRAIRLRDVTCRFPGCRRAATRPSSGTDLDHTVPWPEGETAPDNLAVLCRSHHRLKHSAGWQVTLHPEGTMTWVTPTGRSFETQPWQYTDP